MSKTEYQNGKGDRSRAIPKAFRAGYDDINWDKKPKSARKERVCEVCEKVIEEDEFIEGGVWAVHIGSGLRVYHTRCKSPFWSI